MTHPLSHSGDSVELHERTVEKTAGPATAARLWRQRIKQSTHIGGGYLAPAVLSERRPGDGYAFTQERVFPGETLLASPMWEDGLERVCHAVRGAVVGASRVHVPAEVWLTKLAQIEPVARGPALAACGHLRRVFRDGAAIPVGECHGDLTTCNLLAGPRGRVYAVDFLDCFVETPLFDIAKLRQDTRWGWVEQLGVALPPGRTAAADAVVSGTVGGLSDYQRWGPALELFTLLRVVPYVREPTVADFLQEAISRAHAASDLRGAQRALPGTTPEVDPDSPERPPDGRRSDPRAVRMGPPGRCGAV